MKQAPHLFKFLPLELLTPAFLDTCIATNKQVLPEVYTLLPDHPIDFEALVQIEPTAIEKVPHYHRTQAMKEQAVRRAPWLLDYFANELDPGYSRLCRVALIQEGGGSELYSQAPYHAGYGEIGNEQRTVTLHTRYSRAHAYAGHVSKASAEGNSG
ncbi:hypothetical protein E1189_01025 [Sansalvadorimonas verongulae]|nr:hypothetical protein [Sansalvadorimonas verongulae]